MNREVKSVDCGGVGFLSCANSCLGVKEFCCLGVKGLDCLMLDGVRYLLVLLNCHVFCVGGGRAYLNGV